VRSARPVPEAVRTALFAAAEEVHARHARGARAARFDTFVPTDYAAAFTELVGLRPRADRFVELGAGAGVVTILADLLGYEAYGIEIDPRLVEEARHLAAQFSSRAEFVQGSFFPPGERDRVELLDPTFHTETEGRDAWAELGLELRDFDLIYSYPWPGEEDLHDELFRRHARRGAWLLRYGSRDGFVVRQR
jgi:predicted RNA methylase